MREIMVKIHAIGTSNREEAPSFHEHLNARPLQPTESTDCAATKITSLYAVKGDTGVCENNVRSPQSIFWDGKWCDGRRKITGNLNLHPKRLQHQKKLKHFKNQKSQHLKTSNNPIFSKFRKNPLFQNSENSEISEFQKIKK